MDHHAIARQLRQQAQTIRSLATDISETQASWKPTPEAWSLLEVINHLYDEEREDFRQRVDYILHRPGEDPPAIHPGEWVTARSYNQRDLAASLQNFLDERDQSVAWLYGLPNPVWSNSYHHPAGFTMSAGELLACWAAHDLLHLRQLIELHYAWHQAQAAPLSLAYAGDW
jgi:DinB superfamily